MADVTKIVDKCKRCQAVLKEDEDVYCAACIKAEDDDVAAKTAVSQEEVKTQKEEAPVERHPLISIFVDQKKGPIAIIDSEQGISPQLAFEILLYLTEDLKMNITASRVAQAIAGMSRDAKTFNRLFRGAADDMLGKKK